MIKKFIKWLFPILVTLLAFSGCAQEEPESTEPFITWDNIPQLTYGQMEYEKLSVLPWYSGRTETSTFHKMVETEQGYYVIYNSRSLFYADKADLSNWVPVCNRPDCKHKDDIGCNALCERWVWMWDGRLYFREMTGYSPHLYRSKGRGYIYVSALPDMTDKRLEFVYEEGLVFQSGGGWGASALLGNCIVDSDTVLDELGNENSKWFIYDEDGCREIEGLGTVNGDVYMGDSNNFLKLNGELCFCFEDPGMTLYRLVDDTFIKMNIDANILRYGSYLSGNTVRYFKENEGYYDYDLTTGKTILVSAPYRENSMAYILAPNCIIETNMRYPGIYAKPPQGDSWLAVFDGESWRDVALPPEMETISDEHILYVEGMTSDSILIRICPKRDTMQYNLYRIPIGEEELRLEYCGEITLIKGENP